VSSYRLNDELSAEVKAAADAAGVSGAQWVADAVRMRLGRDDAPEPPRRRRRAARGPSAAGSECRHPANELARYGWGTICGACGKRVR